jgi:hypothetical protein
MLDPRVVDHDADRAHLILDPVHSFCYLKLIGHIEDSREHPIWPVSLPKARLRILQRSLVHAVEHHRRARISKPGRQRTTNAATRTRDQGDPAVRSNLFMLAARFLGAPPTSRFAPCHRLQVDDDETAV